MVSALPPPTGAMDTLEDVLMAVMREDAVSWLKSSYTLRLLLALHAPAMTNCVPLQNYHVSVSCNHSVACGTSRWSCTNGQCISYSQRCDGDRECSDGSDELNCGKYCALLHACQWVTSHTHLVKCYYSELSAGPSEAGRLGRPEPPHFFVEKFVIIARIHSLLSCATPH